MRIWAIAFLIIYTTLTSIAQDSSLVGRFSILTSGLVGKSDIPAESLGKGYLLQLRYFPNPKFAFVLSHARSFHTIPESSQSYPARKGSISLGGEFHLPIGSFSPYIGTEAGLSFTRVHHSQVHNKANQYFQNSLALLLIKPKTGLQYQLNKNLHLQAEAQYYLSFHPESRLNNPFVTESGQSIFWGRKIMVFSLGIGYLFNE
jgi:outer membrane protein W